MTPDGAKALPLREQLAALCHEQWSGWMHHLFSKCVERPRDTGGTLLAVPEWAVERWRRQMETAYADLSHDEKESDRKEADRIIALIGTPDPATQSVLEAQAERIKKLEGYLAHEKTCRHCAEGGCEYCGDCPEFFDNKKAVEALAGGEKNNGNP